ncbi:alpha/beta fold hydrolase [Kutzneria albida]|uniref:Alpha/beta hydrolase fold protein n=1 Tax=Kutzneria albida DSM 43870 TaxID=1449976 RepID=W5WEY0_9PSEU|nr:alpha/beta fold hydrolase [Kutzneria albida]AHH96714.1 alpha/beta hydrolase fold protein [Kutzneria albida DSM 43870]
MMTLLLHGGAGPRSVAAFGTALQQRHGVRVLTPTHPGFDGTDHPAELDSTRALARHYRDLLDRLDLREVTVIGSSIGGWTAAELALLGTERISRLVLVNAVGIEVEGAPVTDIFGLSMPELAALSYHDPAPFAVEPNEQQRAAMAANRVALGRYAPSMTDPTLRERLRAVCVPTLVVWGESDGIVTAEYGRAYAAAIPGARFELVAGAGHLPQLERPEAMLDLLADWVS